MIYEHKIRTGFVFLLFCSLYTLIAFNLYIIQVRQRTFFKELGERQYFLTVKTLPPRAEILDRHGKSLALNHDRLSAFVLPKSIKVPDELKPFLKKHFPHAHEQLGKVDSHFLYVKRKLTDEQLMLVQTSGLEDIQLLKEPSRYYPLPCAAPLVGITDIDNTGLFGIELMLNKQLAGSASTYRLEKDARSGHCYFAKETKVAGHDGVPVQLTIDSDLQFLACEELKQTVEAFKAKEGAVLVLNPTNGEIIVMANYPSVDTDNLSEVDPRLTKNRIVTDVHEPGSIIKVFLALAALEEGVVQPDELIDCENSKVGIVNGFKFGTVKEDGLIPFTDVIANSNNIGVAKIATRLGPKLYEHYRRVGFGTKTGLGWPAEQSGYVNPPKNWSRSSIVVLSFGYEVTASLLQLANAMGIIANNGYSVQPSIILNQPGKCSAKPLYKPETIQIMRNILERAITGEKGTGKRAAVKGYTVLGKTGTANLVINGKYDPKHSIYSFSGIVEKGDYKRVIVTFIKDPEHCSGVYAATVAAPLFNKVAEKVLIHDHII
jgi:cell division protein FtsI (penicillin-binding protein 3)